MASCMLKLMAGIGHLNDRLWLAFVQSEAVSEWYFRQPLEAPA
ncbi:hypothetical protein PS850_06008 [Pseudomonas fluorescens]|nr:hypothetical protein PS850_06008 [Pseudomonas fluorescens]